MKHFFTILIVSVFNSCTYGQNSLEQFVDRLANSVGKNRELKSLSVGVVRNNKIQICYYGDISDGTKPNNSSYFEIASITITFTGLVKLGRT